MGEVYRALDTELGRDVAIKTLPREFCADPEAGARFEREARLVARLSHPTIVTIHDFARSGAIRYSVTELLRGESLQARMRRRPILWEEALKIIKEVAEGLAEAHSNGVVHRDIKPSNIFLTSAGHVKILDFGIARTQRLHDEPEVPKIPHTEAGTILGTVGYMSPEQAMGKKVDSRSDIFSLGCVLFEMLTGSRPFRGEKPVKTLISIINDEPLRLSDYDVNVPDEVEGIVALCLRKKPNQRWQSAAELALALADLAGPTEEATEWLLAEVAARRRGRKWILTAVGLMVVGLLGALGLFLFTGDESDQIESLAVLPFAEASKAGHDGFAARLTEALTNRLTRIKTLRVCLPASALPYRNTTKTLPNIARELNVDAIVEGTVTRSKDRLRIIVHLIDGRTDRTLDQWQFLGKVSDIENLQREIVGKVGEQISISVSPQEKELRRMLDPARQINPEAHHAYVKSRDLLKQNTEKGTAEGLRQFALAIQRDQGYALAFASLADGYVFLARSSLVAAPVGSELISRAEAQAGAADPGRAEAHTTMGIIATEFHWDWSAGEESYLGALAINQEYAPAHACYALLLAAMDRFDEAFTHARQALDLDPWSPATGIVLGRVYYFSGEKDLALTHARDLVKANPHLAAAHGLLGLCLGQHGRFEEAVEEQNIYATLRGIELQAAPEVAAALAAAGHTAAAERLLARLTGEPCSHSSYSLALIQVALGEEEAAVDSLEEAYREHCPALINIAVEPRFEGLHDRADFEKVLFDMKLD